MQYYDITVAANGRQIVEAQGTFLYYLTGNAGGADNTIKVTFGLGGTTVLLKPGQSVRLPDGAKPIDMWRIENYANSQPILGQVLVGAGEFHDSNVTGTVQVVDGGKSRTLGGNAYHGSIFISAGAAQYPVAAIVNPTGSGMRLVLEQLGVGGSIAGPINLSLGDPTTLGLLTLIAPAGIVNKNAGGAQGVAKFYRGALTAAQVANIALPAQTWYLGANATAIFKLTEPVVIPPGQSMLVWENTNAAEVIAANFEWYEETNQ